MDHDVNEGPPETVYMQADLQIEWIQVEGVCLTSINTLVVDSVGHSILRFDESLDIRAVLCPSMTGCHRCSAEGACSPDAIQDLCISWRMPMTWCSPCTGDPNQDIESIYDVREYLSEMLKDFQAWH